MDFESGAGRAAGSTVFAKLAPRVEVPLGTVIARASLVPFRTLDPGPLHMVSRAPGGAIPVLG